MENKIKKLCLYLYVLLINDVLLQIHGLVACLFRGVVHSCSVHSQSIMY